jgi:hypothetical protein
MTSGVSIRETASLARRVCSARSAPATGRD